MSNRPRCKTCRFWDDHGDSGQCRRYAPRHMMFEIETAENLDNNTDNGVWPFTRPDDWCGEYQPKEKP